MSKSDQIDQLITALAIAQGEMSPAQKDGANPHFKSKYSTLSACWESARPVLSKNGLSVIQCMDTVDGKTVLTTTLAHKSGQWIEGTVELPRAEKQTAQTMGSSVTYIRRFAMCSIVGIVPDNEDDDGQAVSHAPRQSYQRAAPAQNEHFVSKEQGEHLTILYSHCSPEHAESVRKSLKSAPIYANNFFEVPQNMFERLVKSAEKNIEQQKKTAQEVTA